MPIRGTRCCSVLLRNAATIGAGALDAANNGIADDADRFDAATDTGTDIDCSRT